MTAKANLHKVHGIDWISGWGRTFQPGRCILSKDIETDSQKAVLFRGLGRSYGDSANPTPTYPTVISTQLADRIRFFDRNTGRIRVEAGLSLHEINRLFLRQGWFVPVSPGTQYVTFGGMAASDVHGKNHHVDGCFGNHVDSLRLRVADGRIVECSMNHEPDLFQATIGGMGLTGHILEVEFHLRRIPTPWIWEEMERIGGIDSFTQALKASAKGWPFTVGWVDCLTQGKTMGRGVLIRGRWANPSEAPSQPPPPRHTYKVPFVWPEAALNPWFVRTFNTLYYRFHGSHHSGHITHPEAFFYPLDTLQDWNKIYGPKGFTQYQCVLPDHGGCRLTRKFLDILTHLGGASFLCVIKDCGPEGRGMLSFPMPGISIAVDMPIRSNTQSVVDTLNEFVVSTGGRIYLCKDTFTRPEHFHAMEHRLERWMSVRRKWDPQGRIRSAQSVRLFGDEP